MVRRIELTFANPLLRESVQPEPRKIARLESVGAAGALLGVVCIGAWCAFARKATVAVLARV